MNVDHPLNFHLNNNLSAQRADPRKQTRLPVLLPVRPSARPRAVRVRAVVTVLEVGSLRTRHRDHPSAARVPALDDR